MQKENFLSSTLHVIMCITINIVRSVSQFMPQMGNIAERLVKEGFARCVDWSMAMVSKDKDKLRAAEKLEVKIQYVVILSCPRSRSER